MDHEPALRLNRAALVNLNIWCAPGFNVELFEDLVQPQARQNPANANAKRPVLIMAANSDDCALKPWITNPRQSQKQLPR
jgi:hypothetical protein